MKDMKLGILYRNDKVVNHRSLTKVILNPILRYFGWAIATEVSADGILGKICLIKCERADSIKYDWDNHNPFDKIIKSRLII